MNFNSRIPKLMTFPTDNKIHTCEFLKAELETATFPIDIIVSEPNLPCECYIKELAANSDGKMTITADKENSDILVLTYTHKDLIFSARKCKEVIYEY